MALGSLQRSPFFAVRAVDGTQVYAMASSADEVNAQRVPKSVGARKRGLAAPRVVRGGAGGLAVLCAYSFRVPARGVLPLAYVARAQGAPLGDAGSAAMEAALRDGVVPFRVDGEARTRWKVAGIIGVDQWTRLACQLRFFWPNCTVLPFRCISKSKFLFF
ncbi:late embryogenesis abundant protein [Zea mays]|uniref:Late embryogenesis abundant protein n=1 Tax=Zea mays TaxID=4577 RepID=A0A1D6H8Y8_MAIZE|nr:late embryogenesis abundant protein [Zea mays]